MASVDPMASPGNARPDDAGLRGREDAKAPGVIVALDRALDAAVRTSRVLVLPLSLLLLLQWPLREIVRAYSTQANDFAQIVFALYASVAVTAATRSRAHLAVDPLACRYRAATRRRLFRAASLLILVPWSLFVLYSAWPIVGTSIGQLEAFPETFNPGYFVLKIAVVLLALCVLLQAVRDLWRGPDGDTR